jgi:hypothetical protein
MSPETSNVIVGLACFVCALSRLLPAVLSVSNVCHVGFAEKRYVTHEVVYICLETRIMFGYDTSFKMRLSQKI